MRQGVPLREALALPALRRARVRAGAAGLERVVRYVNVMEVPDILNWVKPDELLLTTTYPLRDERAALAELVPRLAEKGLAGLAIKPARYLDAIPEVMVQAAERLEFPLLELPPDTSFDDIINAVLGEILNAQALRLERSAAIHDRFTQIVLSGGGLREIALALADLVGRPAAIVDSRGAVLASSSGARRRDDWSLPGPLESGSGVRWVALPGPGGPRPAALQPIRVGAELLGAVLALAEECSLSDDELVALEHAATVAALRLVQARAVAEADRRFQAVCLEELVTGHLADRAVLRERALAFGWDLEMPRAVLVAELEEVGGHRFSQLAGTPEEGWACRRLAEAAAAALGKGAIVWERSAGVAALLVPGPPGSPRESAARLQVEARRRLPGAVVAVGIGRVRHDPLELRHSYAEALRALEVGRHASGAGAVALFEELGLERLLLSCPRQELEAFCQATLGPLVAPEAGRQGELLATLEAYLACNGNTAQAARALYLHYNTLKHRLSRLEELVGPFRDDARRALELALALRIRSLLGS